MKLRLLAILITAVFAGCRTNQRSQAYIDSLHGEVRALEDVIFEQRHELEALRGRLGTGGGGGADPTPNTTIPLITPGPGAQEPQGSGVQPPADANLTPPVITPGNPVKPDEESDPPQDPPQESGNDPDEGGNSAARQLPPPPHVPLVSPAVTQDDQAVKSLRFNARFTGGRNLDESPGDDVLEIGLEPRDANQRVVLAARPISVVVLDPSQELNAARVARWDFTQAQVAAAMQHTGQPVIRLEGVWPKRPPKSGRIHVYARYTTSDGRALETKQIVQIETAETHSARWTPRAPRRESPPQRALADGDDRRAPPAQVSPLGPPVADPAVDSPTQSSARRLPWSPSRNQ